MNKAILTSLIYLSTSVVVIPAFSQTEFIENKGQWDKKIHYQAKVGTGNIFLIDKGFTIVQYDGKALDGIQHKIQQNIQGSQKVHAHAYNVEFLNAKMVAPTPEKMQQQYNNYFVGNSSQWASDVRIYGAVTYQNIYPNIDIRYYTDAGGRLKYDLIVKPGANINDIALKYTGVDDLKVKNKELVIGTSLGDIKELDPYTYQVIGKQRTTIDAKYEVKDNVVRFKIRDYDPTSILVIDPTLKFFSYSGSSSDNWGFTATYGPDGSFFGGGIVFGNNFPVSTGAFDTDFNGGEFDIVIMKLNPAGSNRVYATFIGGQDKDQPHSLITDGSGNLIIAGRTKSANYPGSTFGVGGGFDIVVSKLNAAGNQLIGSMRIGGSGDDGVNINDNQSAGTSSLMRNYGDGARSEVILDASNNIYVASCSRSGNFLTTAGVIQPALAGKQDAVVLKLNPNATAVTWSTYLGGTEDDAAYVLAHGAGNQLYVAGGTSSTNLKGISTSGVISSAFTGGICDGYVIELTDDGTTATRGTYLGTGSPDQVYGVQLDKFGFVYVMGTTEGSWTVLNAPVYGPPNGKQFVSKIRQDLSTYVFSTTFGNGSSLPNLSPTAFLVDRCENLYVSGWGGKANTIESYGSGGTAGLPVTADAIKGTSDISGSDFYFIVLKRDASSQLYGTFFGQDDPNGTGSPPVTFGDHVDGGTSRFDRNGVIYQAMCANCNRNVTFDGTPGAWRTQNGAGVGQGGMCNLGMLKIEMDFSGVAAGPRASIDGVANDSVGCTPLFVRFTDTLQKGKLFVWDFGDGSPKVSTTTVDTSHTYVVPGTYRVMLVAIDSATCNIADTAYLFITAGTNKAIVNFDFTKLPPCTNLTDSFNNRSTAVFSTFGPQSFTWDFGDGTPKVVTGLNPVKHTYAAPGTYTVRLTLSDTTFCNSPEDTFKIVRLSPNLKARISTPATGCVPYNADLDNLSSGGLSFLWDFGDGTTTTLSDPPPHLYNTPGTYKVVLTAFDSTSCNVVDKDSVFITVYPIPVAAFSFSPNPPVENKFTQFTNQSTGSSNYLWKFGDGDSTTEVSPRHIFPSTGTFNVCLTAFSVAGCSDTTCVDVSAIIKPLVDVPNAFTPGKFGANSTIRVEGFGIAEMKWIIYNRWGQKVFETNSRKSGWDGTFKGQAQPMDVYVYTLEVEFSDGKTVRKTGDITLLR